MLCERLYPCPPGCCLPALLDTFRHLLRLREGATDILMGEWAWGEGRSRG